MTKFVMAYDIGGTKIKAGLIAPSGEIQDQATAASHAQGGPQAIMASATQLTEQIMARNKEIKIIGTGIATAGVVDKKQGKISASANHIADWQNFPIQTAFTQLLGKHTVIDNDGNCALLAEVHAQSLEQSDIIFLALGTGLGGAIYSNGKIRTGKTSLAGHFGQTLIGDLSTPENWQCLETILSGSGLAKLARQKITQHESVPTAKELFPDSRAVLRAIANNTAAQAALTQWIHLLANTCHSLQWNYDPDILILGGGLIDAAKIWWHQFTACLTQINSNHHLPAPMDVRPAILGNDAAMVGAGLMAWHAIIDKEHSHAA
ncbi:MAG: ROK family protein [Cellvibrionales bacterium]|nr:ROK family protein [Cellvibrionales bacterium]